MNNLDYKRETYHRYREKSKARWKVWYAANKVALLERARQKRRAQGIGISGTCEVCGFVGKMAKDHNHATGAIRGFLCSHCNLALGHVKDDPKILRGLVKYLKRYA